jgi:hypothetical protein
MAELRTVKHPPNRLERRWNGLSMRRACPHLVSRRCCAARCLCRQPVSNSYASRERVEADSKNEKKVQNCIMAIHASAMNPAETATGMVVGMNVRDDCIPLAKELKMVLKKRHRGDARGRHPHGRATGADAAALRASVGDGDLTKG